MSPRFLGGAAVVARSFARIHETNLKKQGMLPLNFSNPKDYDKVEETDKVSVLGLTDLAPGKELAVELTHKNGKREKIKVQHSFNKEQIEWFKAGSSLNLIRKKK